MVSWNASGHNCCVGLVDQLSASLAGDIIHPYKHKPTFSLSCSLACWFSLVFLVNARAAVHRCPQLWTAERTHTYKQAHTKAKRSPRTVVHSWCSVLAGQVQEIQLQGQMAENGGAALVQTTHLPSSSLSLFALFLLPSLYHKCSQIGICFVY